MGKQSRLRRERHEIRMRERQGSAGNGHPLRVLRAIHRTVQHVSGESPRRCWEYMLEMLAHSSGWQTDSAESKHLWDKLGNETRWQEFFESWMDEVGDAKRNGGVFSEPLGELLEEIEGTNSNMGQFFTPMAVVRMMNAINIQKNYEPPQENGMPSRRALDPCCGTGRFMIDALVHDDGIMMHGIDLDLWLLRTAMLNVRLLCKWTSLRLRDPDDRLNPLKRAFNAIERMEGKAPQEGGSYLMIGGRAIFMHADSLIVDLNYRPNWLCGGWAWGPHPWRENLKIEGYDGSYDEWIRAGSPPAGSESPKEVQFDYSMVNRDPSKPQSARRYV